MTCNCRCHEWKPRPWRLCLKCGKYGGEQMTKTKVNLYYWIARCLPRRVIYFAALHLVAVVTTAPPLSRVPVPTVGAMEAIGEYERTYDLEKSNRHRRHTYPQWYHSRFGQGLCLMVVIVSVLLILTK